MADAFDTLLPGTPGLVPADLNQSCFCITIDRGNLGRALGVAAGNPGLSDQMAATHPHLFSNLPVFLPGAALEVMQTTVAFNIDRCQRFEQGRGDHGGTETSEAGQQHPPPSPMIRQPAPERGTEEQRQHVNRRQQPGGARDLRRRAVRPQQPLISAGSCGSKIPNPMEIVNTASISTGRMTLTGVVAGPG